jgi:hypothetical protein
MSHCSLNTAVRLAAVVLVAAIAAAVAVPAGSQQVVPVREAMGPPSLNGGTVVLHFTALSGGEEILDLELRCASPSFQVNASGKKANGERYSWRLQGQVDVLSGNLIRIDIRNGSLSRQTGVSSMELSFQAGTNLASGDDKTLIKTNDLALRVKAVFEPGE